MRRTQLLAFLLAMLSASCATNGSGPTEGPVVIDTACQWVRPILIGSADQLTDATARQILAHNRAWEATCKTTDSQP